MNTSYVILNRKVSLIIKAFIFNIFLITLLIIWGINTLDYQCYVSFVSKFVIDDSLFYLEVLIPEEEVNKIINREEITINNRQYNYKVHKIDFNIIEKNDINYQKLYLNILNIEPKYLKAGYRVEAKILTDKKKIIEYLKR